MAVGTVLGGRYELLAQLDEGGFGSIWRARDRRMSRDVAVKLLHVAGAHQARFEREATALAQLNHINVVTAFDYGNESATAFLVMELIHGRSLADEFHRAGGRLDTPTVVDIARQALDGLAAAHDAGFIHRDLKPANLMLIGDRPHVKIVDFGIAYAIDASRMTATGGMIGTLPYMAPEQLDGAPVDGRTDLYSLGCMLHEMLAGVPAYRATTPSSWMHAHHFQTPTRVRDHRADVPQALDDFVDRLLAKDPAGRPGDARQALRLLVATGDVTTPEAARAVPVPATFVDPPRPAPASAPAPVLSPAGPPAAVFPVAPVPPPRDGGTRPAGTLPTTAGSAGAAAAEAPAEALPGGVAAAGFGMFGLGLLLATFWLMVGPHHLMAAGIGLLAALLVPRALAWWAAVVATVLGVVVVLVARLYDVTPTAFSGLTGLAAVGWAGRLTAGLAAAAVAATAVGVGTVATSVGARWRGPVTALVVPYSIGAAFLQFNAHGWYVIAMDGLAAVAVVFAAVRGRAGLRSIRWRPARASVVTGVGLAVAFTAVSIVDSVKPVAIGPFANRYMVAVCWTLLALLAAATAWLATGRSTVGWVTAAACVGLVLIPPGYGNRASGITIETVVMVVLGVVGGWILHRNSRLPWDLIAAAAILAWSFTGIYGVGVADLIGFVYTALLLAAIATGTRRAAASRDASATLTLGVVAFAVSVALTPGFSVIGSIRAVYTVWIAVAAAVVLVLATAVSASWRRLTS